MVDQDEQLEMTSGSALRASVAGLLDLGRVPPAVGTVLNLVFAGLGAWLYLATDGWVALAGAVLAIMSVLAIIRWVFQL